MLSDTTIVSQNQGLSVQQTLSPVTKVSPDLETMGRFLEALGGVDAVHTFVCFLETDKTVFPVVFSGTWEQCKGRLEDLNNKGYSACVVVSDTGGTGSKKGDVIAPRALFVDFDGVEPDPKALETLPPVSAVTQSKNGKHLYWFLEDGEALEDLEPALKRLIAYVGADPACKNHNRPMRIPGSLHHKGEPFLTSLASFNPKRRYTIAEVLEGAPELPKEHKASSKPKTTKTPRATTKPRKVTGDNFHAELRNTPRSKQLGRALDILAGQKSGGRNDCLNKVAFWAYALVEQGTPKEYLEAELLKAAMVAGLSEDEALTTIASAFVAAESQGKGLSKTQKLWRDFERTYGADLRYNERAMSITLPGRSQVDLQAAGAHARVSDPLLLGVR